MRIHARDKRKWFAANFGRSYFKSPPLISPFVTIGLIAPIVITVIVALLALPHGDPGAVLAIAPILALKAIFDSQAKESERLVQELAKHMATWLTVKAEYDRLDGEAIELAGKARAAQDAGSPTYIAILSDLKRKRYLRDDCKTRYQLELSRIRRELDELTGPPIQKFHLDSLDRAKSVSSMYQFTRDEKFYVAERDVRMVKVSHNQQRLEAAMVLIFLRIREVRDMRYRSLSEIQAKIAESQRELDEFDFSTLEIVTVSEQTADDMRPHAPEKDDNSPAGFLFGDGSKMLSGGQMVYTPQQQQAKLNQEYLALKKIAGRK